MYRIFKLLPILLAGCVSTPDWETGEGCWRYGVAEDNSGITTRYGSAHDIPIVKARKASDACGERACYAALADEIVLVAIGTGVVDVNHEKCHALLGGEHNSCNGHYAQWGKDIESACNWNL